jgi:TP901 family phage tail tape measure protein
MSTSTEQFSRSLESGKLSLREYYRYGMASTKTFGKNYAKEFSTISSLVEKRVKALQSQYVQLGKDASGALNSMRVTPKNLNYNDQLTNMSMAIQRQQIFNKLLDDGSTKLLNFGKNTQWAGRQLMVGFTIPLAMFAGSAIKSFKEIETQAIRFRKVYGDIFTTEGESDKALKNIRDLAKEYTKYGLKVSETIKMAADAAAAGNSGKQLEEVVKQANKLAVLGGVAQDKALETTIALQNAFSIGSEELGKTMDFLNSVENQTVLSLEDLSNALPKVAPIIKQLGGNVEDLAFFLTAMKEGGISAEQGANALKSGLASLINPSKAASESAAKLGINLKGIVQDNQGNLRNTVLSFAEALQPLTDLQKAQTIEKVFGKYQFARISALLNNVTKEGSQASRVLKMASASAEELALLSQRELKTQESSPMYKMQAAIEKLKASIAPVGELFAKVLTPVIEFFVKLFDKFNNAPEGIKKAIAIIIAAVAGIGPVLLMTVGLVANGLANLMKMFNLIRKGFQSLAYGSKDAALGTQYLTNEELENIAISNSLATSHKALSAAYVLESTSLVALTNSYREAKVAMSSFASTNPGMFMPSVARVTPPRRFAKGVTSVPGTGNQDTTPALLTPGEAVIPADMAKKYAPFIGQMIDGTLPGHMAGRMPLFLGMPKTIKAVTDQRKTRTTMESIGRATEASRFAKMDPTDFGVQLEATTGRSFPVQGVGGLYQKANGDKVFVKPMLDETAALAEQRATIIARDAHGLNAPTQTIRTMIDPTDPLKKRKLIVLEAPYNPEFAKPTGKFTKDEYFRQLVASGLRGDKDLQVANLSGNNLVDVGPAGVFDAASGLRAYSKAMPSVEEQVRINLLGVKGSNTKRFFAEATTNIPKGMTAEQYNQAMIDEINLVLPKLRKTVSGFDLNKDEQAIYQGMIKRLEDTKNANWREIHGIHSSVVANPKKALTPAAIKKIEDEIALRARQKGHGASLSDRDFMEGFAKWAQSNGFAKGGIVPGYMAGRMPTFGPSATAIRVSGAREAAARSIFSAGESSVSRSLLSRINRRFQGDNTEFDLGGIKFTVTPKNLKAVEDKIVENEMYWKSKGLNDEQILEAFKAKMFGDRGIRKISGKTVTASEVGSVLGSGGRGRSSNVTSSAKNRRSLYKDKKIYKEQQQFIDEEEAYLKEVLPADVLATITQPAKKITLPDGTSMPLQRYIRETGDVSKFYSSRALSHITPAAKRMRNAEDDLPEYLFEDTQAMNQALVYYGNAEHPQSRAQAMALLAQVNAKKNSSETFTNFDKYLETALPYRIGKNYYEKFGTASRQDNLIYANKGLFSVPGPKGAGDIVPAMLSPGEAVIPAKQSAKYRPLIKSMISGDVPGYMAGRMPLISKPVANNKVRNQQVDSKSKDLFNPSGRLASNTLIKDLSAKQKEEYDKTIKTLRTYSEDKEANLAIDNALKAGVPKQLLGKALVKLWKDGYYPVTSLKKYNSLTKSLRTKESGTFFRGTGLSGNSYYQKKLGTLPPEISGEIYKILTTLKGAEQRDALSKFVGKPFNMRTSAWSSEESIASGFAKNTRDQAITKKDVIPFTVKTSFKNQDVIPVHSLFKNMYSQKGIPESERMFGGKFVITDISPKGISVERVAGFANGIFSVPGPKGAGDIVPAMLSPGEAVIPAKQSQKYMPLIKSMISDTIPGFENSNITPSPWGGNPGSWRDKGDGWGPMPTAPTVAPGEDKVSRAIDKFFDKPKIKKLGDRIDKLGSKFEKTTPKVEKLDKAVSGTTESFGKDKTRGFRGWLNGFGNVSNTVTDKGVTRTATPEERINMRQGDRMQNAQRYMGVGMAAMMLPMVAQGLAASQPDSAAGQFASKNMVAISVASLIPMFMSIFNSPLKIAGAAALSLAAVFYMQSKAIKRNIIEGQKQAEAMTMTTNQLEALGKITNTMSVTQVEQAKRAGRNTDLVPVSIEFGNNILETSDFGKNLKSSFETTVKTLGTGSAVDSLVNQLGTAVSQGVLTNDQAESIAIALTRNLKDARLELDVRGRLIQLLGPNGENLVNNPLQVQVDLINTGKNLQQAALDNLNLVTKQQVGVNKGEFGQLAVGGIGGGLLAARAGIQAGRMVQGGVGAASLLSQEAALARAGGSGKIGTALKVAKAARVAGTAGSAAVGATGFGAPAALVGAAVSTVIFGGIETAIRSWQKGKEKAAIGKAAGIMQGLVAQNLSASQGSIDALTSQYDSAIANLEIKKKTLKTEKERADIDSQIADLLSKKDSGLKTLRQTQADILGSASSGYDQVAKRSLGETLSPLGSGRGQARDKYMEAYKVGMQEKFKDNAPLKIQADNLQSQLDKIGNDKVTLEISALVTSDVLTPNEASTLVSTMTKTGGDISKNLKAMVNVQGTEGLQRLSTILTLIPEEENKKELFLEIKEMNKTDADATLSAIEELGKIPDFVGIELGLETNKADTVRLKAVGKEITALKKQFPTGKLSLKALVKMQEEAGGKGKNLTLDSAIAQWDAINKLPKNLQFQAMITIGAISQSDSFEKILDRELSNAFYDKNPDMAQSFVDPKKEAAKKAALEAFKKDSKNIQAVTKKYFGDLSPQLFGTATADDLKKQAAIDAENTLKSATSFLDDLGMKLKLFRDQAFDALNPLKSIMSAFTNTKDAEKGLGRMFEKFNGLQQIMLQGNLSPVLMDAISGMSAEEFKAFQNMDLNPNTKAKETPFIMKDGNIVGLSTELMGLSEAFNSVNIGMAQMGAAQSIDNIKKQQEAFKILKDAGMSVTDALKVIQDQSLASAIAAGTLGAKGSDEMKKFIKDIAEANSAMEKMQVITDTLTKNAEFDVFAKTPDVAKAMKSMGYSVEQIDAVLGNPAMLKQFTQNIKDGKIDIAAIEGSTGAISEYLKDIESKKLIDIQINFNKGEFGQVASSGLDMVNQMFAVQEDLIRTGVDPRSTKDVAQLAANESKIKELQAQLRPYEAQIEQLQYKINDIQASVALNISQKVDKYQKEINDLQREIEVRFNEPIKDLQDELGALSNDLDVINNASEKITKEYDKQAEALQSIKDINDSILKQEEGRIDLASALSSGDISAAAKAMQAIRRTNLELSQSNAQKALEKSRKDDIEGILSASRIAIDPITGKKVELGLLTQEEIKQRQFELSQKIYSLDTDPKKLSIQDQIKSKTNSIYTLEQARSIALEQVQTYETEIAKITKDNIVDKERMIAALNNENEIIEARLEKLEKEIEVLGRTREAWTAIEAKVKAYDLSRKDLDTAFAGLLAASTAINAEWTDIMTKIGAYAAAPTKDSKIMTTAQTIVTNSGSKIDVAASDAADRAAADKIIADAKAAANKIIADAQAASDKAQAEADALVAAAKKKAEEKAAAEKAAAEAKTADEKTSAESYAKVVTEAADAAIAAADAATQLANELAADVLDYFIKLNQEIATEQSEINIKLGEAADAAIARTNEIIASWGMDTPAPVVSTPTPVNTPRSKEEWTALQLRIPLEDRVSYEDYVKSFAAGATPTPVVTPTPTPTPTPKTSRPPGISPGNWERVGYIYNGGLIPKYFSAGGFSKGTDTIPAMLTPGEFVIKKSAVDSYGVKNLSKINSGMSPDSSVYNYSLSVNVSGNNLNADDIASTVMQKIKYIDGQRVRGQR